jgi:hypothetical protein
VRRLKAAESDLKAALDQIFQTTLVFQAGGNNDMAGSDITEKVKKAAETSLTRLYPQFAMGDDPRWDKVIDRSKGGDGDPLKPLDYDGNTESHPICAKLLPLIGTGKKGSEIRGHFGGKPYGWPKDTIDGALLALCAGGHVRCTHQGKTLEVGIAEMEQETRRERQAAGIAVAKKQGKYKGRKVGTTKATPERARQLRQKGLSAEEIGKSLGVSRNTVFRYFRQASAWPA